ncbi:MAG: hypothetical protein IJR26_04470 [Bacteroidales bacterium]|nr:hypothetical protein [Bacteroidales bacterium]
MEWVVAVAEFIVDVSRGFGGQAADAGFGYLCRRSGFPARPTLQQSPFVVAMAKLGSFAS